VPASTLLVGGFSGAIGCAYVPSTHKVVLVEFNTGRIDAIDLATNVRTTLGVGYTNPESIVIASNGDTR
jgi:hypothetical protein